MPQTAFAHTGAGVKSSVLFLRKWTKKQTEEIKQLKRSIQDTVKQDNKYAKQVNAITTEKRKVIKAHTGFVYITDKTDKKLIEQTDEFKDWKKEISSEYSQKINDLKDELEEEFLKRKQEQFTDYPIFMAIAEDIGYDATGKPTGNNELDVIEDELTRFINQIN
jgi:type I restriction enzyme M protein